MKTEDKVMYAVYGLFGAFLGFMVYAAALGAMPLRLIFEFHSFGRDHLVNDGSVFVGVF